MIYLVVAARNNPGRILAVFANEADAENFADLMADQAVLAQVTPRTIWHGPLLHPGFHE